MGLIPPPRSPSEPALATTSTPTPSADGEDVLGLRIAAALIDLAILSVLLVVLSAATGEAIVERGRVSFFLGGLDAVVFLALALGYYFALEAAIGQTVGKLLVGLRVVGSDGGRPSARAVGLRTALRAVDWLPAFYLVGFVATLATGPRRQRLGDLAARTSVVRTLPVRQWGLAAALLASGLVAALAGTVAFVAVSDGDAEDTDRPHGVSSRYPDGVQVGEIVVQDDFSDPSSGWPSGPVDGTAEVGYGNGTYRIVVDQPQIVWSDGWAGQKRDALRVDVEATQLAADGADLVGVTCYSDFDAQVGYYVGVAPAQQGYAVYAFQGDDYRLMESANDAVDGVGPLGEENELRVECLALPQGPTLVTLAVNGEPVVLAEDDDTTTGGFDGVGLFVDTSQGGAEVIFDDFVATELMLPPQPRR
jgi:uncharacterized RDD family membrane protein YckC